MSAALPAGVLVIAALILLAWVEARTIEAGRAYLGRVTGKPGSLGMVTGLRRGIQALEERLPAVLRQRDELRLGRARLGVDRPTLLSMRLLAAAAGALIWPLALAGLARGQLPRLGPVVAAGAAGGLVALEVWLTGRVAGRRARIRAAWPSFLQRLALSLRAGLGLERSLEALLALEIETSGPLREELQDVALTFRSGLSCEEALRQWAASSGLPEVELLASVCQRCRQLGLPLGPAIDGQHAVARSWRHNRHQAWLNGLPGRISIAAMLLFMPAVLIVVLLPNVVAFLRSGW